MAVCLQGVQSGRGVVCQGPALGPGIPAGSQSRVLSAAAAAERVYPLSGCNVPDSPGGCGPWWLSQSDVAIAVQADCGHP